MYKTIRNDVLGLWFCETEDAKNISEELRRRYARKAFGVVAISIFSINGGGTDKHSLIIVRDVYYSAKLSAWQRFKRFWRRSLLQKAALSGRY